MQAGFLFFAQFAPAKRLQDAQEQRKAELAEVAGKQLGNRIKACAWDICEKCLCPPKTTDIGILFLPTGGLFAEVSETWSRPYRATKKG